ncbi:Glu/Leu/Phe/Val dehydrogenase, partial [Aeromonas dhakensis]
MYDAAGIDTRTVPSHDEEPEAVTQYATDVISNDELLELDVDVLIPAAVGNVITETNANSIQADIIVEGANGPITSA